jgi:hypothetical protein
MQLVNKATGELSLHYIRFKRLIWLPQTRGGEAKAVDCIPTAAAILAV